MHAFRIIVTRQPCPFTSLGPLTVEVAVTARQDQHVDAFVHCELYVCGKQDGKEEVAYFKAPDEFQQHLRGNDPQLLAQGKAAFDDLRLYRHDCPLTNTRLRKSSFVQCLALRYANLCLGVHVRSNGIVVSDVAFSNSFRVLHRSTIWVQNKRQKPDDTVVDESTESELSGKKRTKSAVVASEETDCLPATSHVAEPEQAPHCSNCAQNSSDSASSDSEVSPRCPPVDTAGIDTAAVGTAGSDITALEAELEIWTNRCRQLQEAMSAQARDYEQRFQQVYSRLAGLESSLDKNMSASAAPPGLDSYPFVPENWHSSASPSNCTITY